jgi:hypothetical protein
MRQILRPKGSGPKPIVSAFDDAEGCDVIELGKQFVHYAMTGLPPKIEFSDESPESEKRADSGAGFSGRN